MATKLFEDRNGTCVDFYKDILTANPKTKEGTLFLRDSAEDFWFKVGVADDYFKTHNYLRHEHFLSLIAAKREAIRLAKKQEEEDAKQKMVDDIINHVFLDPKIRVLINDKRVEREAYAELKNFAKAESSEEE